MHLKLAFIYFLKPFDVWIGKQRDKVRQISMLWKWWYWNFSPQNSFQSIDFQKTINWQTNFFELFFISYNYPLHDCNGTQTHNQLVRKRTLNHLVKLDKWLNCVVSTYKWGIFCLQSSENIFWLTCMNRNCEILRKKTRRHHKVRISCTLCRENQLYVICTSYNSRVEKLFLTLQQLN